MSKINSSETEKRDLPTGEYDLSEIKEWRPVFYKLAWLGFSYPDNRLLNQLGIENLLEGMNRLSRIYGLGMSESLSPRVKEISNKSEDKMIARFQTEYVRLFVADLGGPRVQPYGSIYIDGEIRGESTRKAVEAYCKTGYEKSDEYCDLPDHISVELEYLYRLSQADNHKYLKLQRDFLDEFLSPWHEEFTTKVCEETEHWFYELLATWTSKGLKRDRKLLEKIMNLNLADQGGRK